jgi:glycine cleavage system aminomethyltransferase T/glycine/D-amino acid oxidase-like deaminating enzyme
MSEVPVYKDAKVRLDKARSLGAPPSHAQVVIIGGGVIGCNVAYHLTKLGWTDVVLLERKQLTCGTTWHAAGLVVSGGMTSETMLYMASYTVDLYSRLEQETGQPTGFKRVGYMELASTPAAWEELRRAANFMRGFGSEVHEISPKEIKDHWPLAETDDLLGGLYFPDEGRTNPIDTTVSLAKGAKMGGAQIFEDTRVTGIKRQNGRVAGVITEKGEIEAEYVVNCCGMWAREVGNMAGVAVPLQAAEHYYLLTEPFDGMHPDLPIIEDLNRYSYYREEVGGLMLGLFEPDPAPWGMGGIARDFAFGQLNPDWDRLLPHIEQSMERIPAVKDVGVRMLFCGPESFTPDLSCHMGEAPSLKNYFVAAGMNSLGVLLGGGVGQVMAHWIVEGLPPVDVTGISLDRVVRYQNNREYLYQRGKETLGLTYLNHWPNYSYRTARGVRQSALHDRLADSGAYFAESVGWEYADWFAPQGVEPKPEYSWGRQNWFEYNAAEHQAVREGVTLMDMSLMSKFLVQGRDAERILNRISANNVSVPVGKIVYTQWLNQAGGIEADLTVTRLAEDRYMVICGDSIHTRVESIINRNISAEDHAFLTDVTSGYAMINVQGPKSRQLLSQVTSADISHEAFPYMTMQEIDVGYALPLAFRITYLGELGYELYIPTEFAVHVYDLLKEAGEDLGVVNIGMQALNTTRIEKAYRDYGHDMDNADTPLEAGLGFAVDFDKPGGFIGREALLRQREAGPAKRRLVQFLLRDPEPLLYHGEPIYRDGVRVGHIQSGAYGFTLGGAVGLGYIEHAEGVTRETVDGGKYEILVVGDRCPAQASLRPMYDPKGERIRR